MNNLPDNLIDQIFKHAHELNYCSVMEEMIINRLDTIHETVIRICRNPESSPPKLQDEARSLYDLLEEQEYMKYPYHSLYFKSHLEDIRECPLFDIYDIDEWYENEADRLNEIQYNLAQDESDSESEPESEPQGYRGRLRTTRTTDDEIRYRISY